METVKHPQNIQKNQKNPLIIKGKHNEALVFAKTLEASCEDKIRQYLDHAAFSGTKVRVMPDVHLGKSAVIGFTATFTNRIIPSIIGVDIGCGVCACNLGIGKLPFDKLDAFIRKNVPSGMDVRKSLHEKLDDAVAFIRERGLNDSAAVRLKSAIRKLSEKQGHTPERVFAALGTLGGGNHFIEINADENHNRWLLIHSGSRILGARTAEYHEIAALRETPDDSPLKYVSGDRLCEYRDDIAAAQLYAITNRVLMAFDIAGFFKIKIENMEFRDSVHNYLDPSASMIRKGAISARAGEPVVIPFSMAEGAVLGRGKGNTEWNISAPHGAGRKMSRSQSRAGLSMDEYRRRMRGVWSSTVCKETLDESPMAYKRAKDILEFLDDTIEIERRLIPLYNFKSPD